MTPELLTLVESAPSLALAGWTIWRLFLLVEKLADAIVSEAKRALDLAARDHDEGNPASRAGI